MKSQVNIIRAWTDEAYRNSLTNAQRADLPARPEGMTELTGEEAAARKGGMDIMGLDPAHLGIDVGGLPPTPGAPTPVEPDWQDEALIGFGV